MGKKYFLVMETKEFSNGRLILRHAVQYNANHGVLNH